MSDQPLFNPFRGAGAAALEAQAGLLAEVTAGFARSLHIKETLSNAIARFMVYLNAEAASIFLLENGGTELVCHDCAGPVDIVGLRLDARQGIVGKAVRDNVCQMVRDVQQDPHFAGSVDAGTGFVTRSILCAPLTVRGECIGALELINKRTGDGLFDVQDQHLVTAIASSAALAIHNARMAGALVEQERMRKELELAREIQVNLLPAAIPGQPVAGLNIPARVVSGDFYDYFLLPDGRWYFNLADVSGKGMNAALFMAKTSSLLRCLAKTCTDPGNLLSRVNEELCETASRGMFVTIVTGFLDAASGRILLANAGHQPPLLRARDGTYRELPAEAPPVGVESGTEFPCTELELGEGSLYLYTDGVTETAVAGRALGVQGLSKLIEEGARLAPTDRLEHIVEALQQPGSDPHDDITIMLIEAGRR